MPYADIEKRRACRRRWKVRNPEKVNADARRCYQRHKERFRANALVRYYKNQLRQQETSRKWKQRNQDQVREYERKHRALQILNDLNFCIRERLRTRIRVALRGGFKAAKTSELIGCSLLELRLHLEKQFRPGMTWENWSPTGWHVDHIRPCASFDLTDPAQQKLCFHYSNLQPLFAEENLRKGAKY